MQKKDTYRKQQVVAKAREWIGTPFHHQGRVKATSENKGGCDCLGLLVGVARELHLHAPAHLGDEKPIPLSAFDQSGYGHVPNTRYLRDTLNKLFMPVALEDVMPGDIMLLRIDGRNQHLAIVSDYPYGNGLGIIHALASARKVVEHRFDAGWRENLVGSYSLYSVA